MHAATMPSGKVYVPVLAIVYLIAVGFLTGYKISRETHFENVKRLSQ
jgi:hypothetical protein